MLNIFKDKGLETGFVSFIKCNGGEVLNQLGPLERPSLNHWSPKKVQSRVCILLMSSIITGIRLEEFEFHFSFLVASIIIVIGNFPILMSFR
jgi:hypothetical protein